LRDHALGSRRNGRLLATGDLDGFAITLNVNSVFVHGVLFVFRAKSRNFLMLLERASSPSSPEKVVNYYATNRENDERRRHVQTVESLIR
jgi:hypothetical protein